MKSPLHILHLEDNASDAAFVQHTLESGGIACRITCVEDQPAFVNALERGGIDLVLADYSLPGFDGLSAVRIVRQQWPDLPFILVSGTLGEELAIDSLKSGATDYVLKERLSRLVPAVRRAMQEVAEHAERRRLEAQFIAAQKMEVLGQLAGGVAHDFNNIIAAIMGYSDLLLAELGTGDPGREYAEEIQHVADRAAGLTRQLLLFSRRETVQPVVLDLNRVVRDLEKMLRRLLYGNVTMTFDLASDTGRIRADSGYIGQLLMNLVVNARDALPNGGQITITTRNRTVQTSHDHPSDAPMPGEYVVLSVQDTGTGMTDEVKSRLFEPFFTTKPAGRGTGLGLATCHTIVQQSSGQITVETAVGRGSTFQVFFPRVQSGPLVETTPSTPGPLPRGSETLMVVEDDPAVRSLACSVLENQGYTVLSATNGREAGQLAVGHSGTPVRLVISDFSIFAESDQSVASWWLTLDPEPQILFTSGYTDDVIVRQRVPAEIIEFLPKPFSPATLVRKVREILDR